MFRKIINKLILIVLMLSVFVGAGRDSSLAEMAKRIDARLSDIVSMLPMPAGVDDRGSDEVKIEEFVVNKSNHPNDPVATIYTEESMLENDLQWNQIYKKVTETLCIHSNLKSAGLRLSRVGPRKFSLLISDTIIADTLHPNAKLDSGKKNYKIEIPLFLNCLSIMFPDGSIFNNLGIINEKKNIFRFSELLAEMNRNWPERIDNGEFKTTMPCVAIRTAKWEKSSTEFRKYIENLPYPMTIAQAVVDFISTKGFDEYEMVARNSRFRNLISEMRKRFTAIHAKGKSSDSSSSNPLTKIRLVPASLVDSDEIDHNPDANSGYDSETNEFRLRVSRMDESYRNPTDETRWHCAEDDARGSVPRKRRRQGEEQGQDSVSSLPPIKRIRISDDNLDQSEDRNIHEHGAAQGSGEVAEQVRPAVENEVVVEFVEAEYEEEHQDKAVADEAPRTPAQIRPVYEPVTEDPYDDPVDESFESVDAPMQTLEPEGDLAVSQVKEELPSLVNNPRVMPIFQDKKKRKIS